MGQFRLVDDFDRPAIFGDPDGEAMFPVEFHKYAPLLALKLNQHVAFNAERLDPFGTL